MSAGPLRSALPADSPIRHLPPILCIERVLEVGAEAAVGECEVRPGAHVQDGRMWVGGLVEGLAQTSTLLERPRVDGESADGVGMLVGIRHFVVARRPRVGERVLFRVELVRRLGPFLLVNGRALCGDELLAEGELKFYWRAAAAPDA